MINCEDNLDALKTKKSDRKVEGCTNSSLYKHPTMIIIDATLIVNQYCQLEKRAKKKDSFH